MQNNKPDYWIDRAKEKYKVQEDNEFIVWALGIVLYNDQSGNIVETIEIGKMAFAENLNFSFVSGWFKIVVYSKSENEWLFFGDNSGSQYFLFDNEKGVFSDSLLKLRSMRGKNAEPDLESVSEIFFRGRILGEKTLIKGIHKTDPDYFYRTRNGRIEKFSKQLACFSSMPSDVDIDDTLKPIIESIRNEKICAVCTGGTDSRTVIADLIHRKIRPDLVITGHRDNVDIPVAKKIAETLQLPLKIIEPSNKDPMWLEKSFVFLDGAYDIVLGFRHFQKALWVKSEGYSFELGGVGGEFYKNAFCNPIRWGRPKEKDINYYLQTLFRNSSRIPHWYGNKLILATRKNCSFFAQVVQCAMRETNFLQVCNHIGFDILRSGSGAITNGYSTVCCKVDPLMDMRLIGAASHDAPLSHSMHIWQRKQINKYCKSLSNIKTDQGYTCSMNLVLLFTERIKKLLFYLGRAIVRVKKKLNIKNTPEKGYWASDYEDARKTNLWVESITYCKRAGIISVDALDEGIPLEQTGWIILIGMMFSDKFENFYEISYEQQ